VGKIVFHLKNSKGNHNILLIPSACYPLDFNSVVLRKFIKKYEYFFPITLENFLNSIVKSANKQEEIIYLGINHHLYHYPTNKLFKFSIDHAAKNSNHHKVQFFFCNTKPLLLGRLNWLKMIPLIFNHESRIESKFLYKQRYGFLFNLFFQIFLLFSIIHIAIGIPRIIDNIFFH
jgi:hypothetical protein